MRPLNGGIALGTGALTLVFWALYNQPVQAPPWPDRVQGFSFSPFRSDDDAVAQIYPRVEEIDADLALLAGRTHAVRTYTVESPLDTVPELAERHGINVALGVWVDPVDEARTRGFIERAVELANTQRNVVRLVVGNEAVLRNDLPVDQLTAYLDEVRARVGQPVSTAEPWHVWLSHPELVDHVDYLAVHMLPYWEGVDVESAVDHIVAAERELAERYPDKPIVLAEVGWPSDGRTRWSAVASTPNEAWFLRHFLAEARERGWIYYLMEAFDQPWKAQTEGAVGAYWGVYDAERNAKFPLSAGVVRIPDWPVLAALSIFAAAMLFATLLRDGRRMRPAGRMFLAGVSYAAATVAVWVLYDYSCRYLTPQSVAVGVLLTIGMGGLLLVLFSEAHEWAEASWAWRGRRVLSRPQSRVAPLVSIHVPAHDEPAAMLIETLDALARLEYPRFEVLVIDNNTRDETKWRPVEAHCRMLGQRFRFFHVDPLAGFKAGALNFALAHTHPDAEVVAVIDSDYVVEPGWLRDLVPMFAADPKLAVVQAPQDYRDAGESAWKAMMYAEYRGFFRIGMVTRNERDAIIQHGTMTLVRRGALESVGGWAEWCITEDADLGLRLLEEGYRTFYVPRSYGRGLMPDRFLDYKLQRFRWAFGAVRILRRHVAALLRGQSQLSRGQRYHFVAGWLPWLADGANLLLNAAALAWSCAMILWPARIDPPLIAFSAFPVAMFVFKIAKLLHLYETRVGANLRQTIGAGLAGLALTHTVGRAVLAGAVGGDRPFVRTPKLARQSRLVGALWAVREEALWWAALVGVAALVRERIQVDSPDVSLWVAMLLIQSIPYAATLVCAVLSALPAIPAHVLGPLARIERRVDPEDTFDADYDRAA